MRIRKNAKLSSILGLSSPSHVCQLNQSPWDVIPFSSSPHDHFSPPAATTSSFHPPLDGDDSLTGNASFGESLGAVVDSGVEMVVDDDEDCDIRSWKQEEEAPDDNEDNDNNDNEDCDSYNYRDERAAHGVGMVTRGCCKWTSGKGRQCSREAKAGRYLCERHLKPHRDTDANNNIESPALSTTRKGRRGRPPKRAASAKSQGANNSNQFYYYSGFGPSWGRRRTERGGNVGGGREESAMETGGGGESSGRSSSTPPPPPSGRVGIGEEADYAGVYDIDEDEESSGGDRKRTRKPVKARSLKSLM